MLGFCVLAWGLLFAAVFLYCRRVKSGSVGLPLAYVSLLSIAHCGAVVYLFPHYDPSTDPYLAASGVTAAHVTAGFAASTLALLGFCMGTWIFDLVRPARRAAQSTLSSSPENRTHPAGSRVSDHVILSPAMPVVASGAHEQGVARSFSAARLPNWHGLPTAVPRQFATAKPGLTRAELSRGRNLVIIGFAFYFIFSRAAGWLPSAAGVTSVGGNLVLIGLCLLASTWPRRTVNSKFRLILMVLSLPLISVLTAGFLGFGVTAVVIISCFFVRFLRVRWWHAAAAPVVLWLGLSVFVSYMAARSEIRKAVWGGQGMAATVQVVAQTLLDLQLFDPWNSKHLHPIDARMNQNALVGRAIHYMEREKKDFAYGRTLGYAAIAWIPRILWPGKPEFGGSQGIASEFTGMVFAQGTSVGIGNVLELFANFGYLGVWAGMLAFGAFVRSLDLRAAAALQSSKDWDFVFFHLVGISALQPGGMWAEVVGSCAAAIVLVSVLRRTGMRP